MHKMIPFSIFHPKISGLEAGGKPSTWFPPGGLVELIRKPNEALLQIHLEALLARFISASPEPTPKKSEKQISKRNNSQGVERSNKISTMDQG